LIVDMSGTFVTTEIIENYGIITMCREPVNSMNLDFWKQLFSSFESLEKNHSIRGVIFRSGLVRDVFTAGNDLKELYAPNTNQDRYTQFNQIQNLFLPRLYSSRLVTIAAIKGACPAGGCILALCCDYRIITEEGRIGLNEVALGISVPWFWMQLMTKLIGHGPAERLLQFGKMLKSNEAKMIGIIDEVVTNDKLLHTAESRLKEFLVLPDPGRVATKQRLRSSFSKEWEVHTMEESKNNWNNISNPAIVKSIAGALERLSRAKM